MIYFIFVYDEDGTKICNIVTDNIEEQEYYKDYYKTFGYKIKCLEVKGEIIDD